VLLAVTPLFWITGLRPMSDMFGLGVALAAQALILRGRTDRPCPRDRRGGRGTCGWHPHPDGTADVPLLAYALLRQRHGASGWFARLLRWSQLGWSGPYRCSRSPAASTAT
jgi:hypothetical protein